MTVTQTSVFQRQTAGGIRLHVLPTDRFKTFAVSVFIGAPLREDTITKQALIPFVLRRGNEAYPETKQFRERLDDLYGAGFGFDVYKRGDYQMVQFRMDVINDRFVQTADSLLEQSFKFLGETITKPATENGRFLAKYVEAEKKTLERKLQSIINDKIRYAAERCLEEMCEGEPYRLHPLGKLEDLPAITPEGLFAAYREWLAKAPIDVYVVGETTPEQVEDYVNRFFRIEGRAQSVEYRMEYGKQSVREVKRVTEEMEVNQGKLNMGLRSAAHYASEDYPAALLYNGILGGFPHAKLFTNVREKESLAYYASSRFDGHKGIVTIQSGIEIANYEKAVDIILKQLEAIKKGEISDLELAQTRAMIVNQLREIQDSAYEMIMFDFNTVLSGRERTTAQLIEAVQTTGLDAIKRVAEGVRLDTIYFLRDRKEVFANANA
ncbi:EF-P 5-aminopentanol modification-associated protein YfmF [Paenibacillus turpanensis]|uniref:EF-P 5-aminopentanol modification-associated protein YfmF n=1 Tax=Paenibacillus turpanensis TaxID=2689078 RepID=UPI001407C4B7|nr:pitrilysin family protein [Paenibacillus turpanensis]